MIEVSKSTLYLYTFMICFGVSSLLIAYIKWKRARNRREKLKNEYHL